MAVLGSSAGDRPLPRGGTFSANPLSMVAGIASLTALDRAAFDHLEHLGEKARNGIAGAAAQRGLPIVVTGTASLFRIHIKAVVPRTYREAWPTPLEAKLLKAMSQSLIGKGVIMPALTTSSLSTPMTDDDIDFLLAAISEFFDSEAAKRMIE